MSEIWNLSALCRCCHADGEFKSLQMPYCHGGKVEVYSNMLRECLGISIVPPPIEASYSICETCILKLREANSFRKQVLDCEQKFIIYCQNETAGTHDGVSIKLEPIHDDEQEDKYANSVEAEVKSIDKCLLSLKECKDEADDFEPCDERDYEDDKSVVKSESKKKIKKEESKKKVVKKVLENTSKKKTKQEFKQIAFFCAACPEARFSNKQELQTHVEKTHTSSIKCNICSLDFKNYRTYKSHINKCNPHHFKCNFCEKSFTSGSVLMYHENWVHTKQNLLKCDICQKDFGNKSVLRKHVLFHLGLQKTCKCDICGKLFNDKTNMKIHKEIVHEGVKNFSCHACDRQFSLKKNLKLHLQKHSGGGQHKCSLCPKKFFESYQLKVHIERVHKNVKKYYKCKVCEKKIENRGPYQRHLREHSAQGLLPFTCEICGKNFSTKYVLNRHIACHLDSERTKFSCEICEKKFTTKAVVERHIKTIHNEENKLIKKVRCPLCNSHVKDLERHQKKHKIRPHVCSVCNKTYPAKNTLNRHVKLVHLGLRLHCCQLCNKEYTRQDVLQKHMKRHHSNLFSNYPNVKVEPEQSEQNIPVYNIGFRL